MFFTAQELAFIISAFPNGLPRVDNYVSTFLAIYGSYPDLITPSLQSKLSSLTFSPQGNQRQALHSFIKQFKAIGADLSTLQNTYF